MRTIRTEHKVVSYDIVYRLMIPGVRVYIGKTPRRAVNAAVAGRVVIFTRHDRPIRFECHGNRNVSIRLCETAPFFVCSMTGGYVGTGSIGVVPPDVVIV